MKIGIDIRCLAEGKKSGVEEYTLALLEHVFKRDRENQYILFCNSWKPIGTDLSFLDDYPNVSLRSFRFPNKLLNFFLWYLRWPKLDRLIGGADVFFVPNLNFVAVSGRTKLCITAHDLSFEYYPETFSWKRRLWHFLVHFQDLCRRADAIIAISDSTKADLMRRYHVPEEKITVIRSGVAARFAPMDRNHHQLLAVQAKYRLPYRFILSLGTFEPRKNLAALVQAYTAMQRAGHRELDRYALVIAGSPGWKEEELYASIYHSPVREKILSVGFVEEADKSALYNLASLFVYPSFYEGFGFPPLEAMASGLPTIVSHTSSFPEIVGEAAIMIDPNQPQELMQAMRQVLLDKEWHHTLSARGIVQARQFQWDAAAEKLIQLWRKLGPTV